MNICININPTSQPNSDRLMEVSDRDGKDDNQRYFKMITLVYTQVLYLSQQCGLLILPSG